MFGLSELRISLNNSVCKGSGFSYTVKRYIGFIYAKVKTSIQTFRVDALKTIY